jgi:hypothetical protein
MSKLQGGCACGDIRFDCADEPNVTAVCHCPDCQKLCGTAFSIVVGINSDSLVVEGEPNVFETIGQSGQAVERNFCGKCGSPLYSVVHSMPGTTFLKAGTLDDTSWLDPTIEFFCETAQPWLKKDDKRVKFPLMPE